MDSYKMAELFFPGVPSSSLLHLGWIRVAWREDRPLSSFQGNTRLSAMSWSPFPFWEAQKRSLTRVNSLSTIPLKSIAFSTFHHSLHSDDFTAFTEIVQWRGAAVFPFPRWSNNCPNTFCHLVRTCCNGRVEIWPCAVLDFVFCAKLFSENQRIIAVPVLRGDLGWIDDFVWFSEFFHD